MEKRESKVIPDVEVWDLTYPDAANQKPQERPAIPMELLSSVWDGRARLGVKLENGRVVDIKQLPTDTPLNDLIKAAHKAFGLTAT